MEVIPGGANEIMANGKEFQWIDVKGQPTEPPTVDETEAKMAGRRSYSSKSGMKLLADGERKVSYQ